MSTRAQLEADVAAAKKRIDETPEGTPQEVINQWREEYDNLSLELNNLYDDEVNEFTE